MRRPAVDLTFNPGVELVMEAHEGYWRKVPSVKRIVWKVAPDEATRLAMLKRGEADIIHLLQGEVAEAALGVIPGYSFSTPYEDVCLKGK